MNVADLDFKTANWIVLAISLLIGLGYVAVMPRASRRTDGPTPKRSASCSA